MRNIDEHKKKLGQLRRVIRLCEAESRGIYLHEIESKLLCSTLFFVTFGLLMWLVPFVVRTVCLALLLFLIISFIYPYLRSKLRSNEERIYAIIYSYESPLEGNIKESHNTYLAYCLSLGQDDGLSEIQQWARTELREVKKIIYDSTKEGEMRKILIEKVNDTKNKTILFHDKGSEKK